MAVVSTFALLIATSPVAPIAFELQAPEGPQWAARAKETAAIAAETLGVRTTLSIRSGRDLGVADRRLDACRRQPSLTCWVRTLADLRSDLFVTRSPEVPTEFLLVRLLPLPRPDRSLVLLWLVDLEGARRGLRDVEPVDLEAWLLRNVTVRRRAELEWGDGALERSFERLWQERQPHFRGRGYWRPTGSIRVQTEWIPPFHWTLDGARVRTATSATVIVPRVAVGVRRLKLQDAETRIERTVSVEMGRQTVVHVSRSPIGATSDERSLLLWSGIGVAVAGAAVAAAGLLVPVQSELVQVCSPSSSCPPPAQFARTSDYFSARTSPDGGTGPMVVPLGYSLVITGGMWAATAALWDEPQVPWWMVLLGAVAGGAAYSVSEAIE